MFKTQKIIEARSEHKPEILHLAIQAMVIAIDTVSIKLLKHNESNMDTVNTFTAHILGFDTFYIFMPTRILALINEVHEDIKYRDYVLEIVEKMVFHLKLHNGQQAYAELCKAIYATAELTKAEDGLCPDNFRSTVKLTGQEYSLLTDNPLLVLFYIASMYYNYSIILNKEMTL
jgi:hypothetical protein